MSVSAAYPPACCNVIIISSASIGDVSDADTISWFIFFNSSAYSGVFMSSPSGANKLVVVIRLSIDFSKSIPSSLDNFTPSSRTCVITLVVLIPALANASNPSVMSDMFIPNLLENSIALSPTIPALIPAPPIACMLATCCWKSIALFVASTKAALTMAAIPIAITSVWDKNSDVLNAISPNIVETVFDKPANSLPT